MLVDHPEARAVFVDLPPSLNELALNAMRETVAEPLRRPWTDDHLCRDIADALAGVAWVEKVRYVRRRPDARILISCRYRMPLAMVRIRLDPASATYNVPAPSQATPSGSENVARWLELYEDFNTSPSRQR